VSGAAALLLAAALITFTGGWIGSMVSSISPDAWFQELAGPDAEQAMAVRGAADYLYDCIVKGWPEQARDSMTVGALMNFDEFVTRAKTDGLVSYAVGEPVRLGPGVWDVPVIEKTHGGSRTVTVTVNLRVLVAVQGWQSDWVITEVRGEGLTPRPSP
jgi:hypothetical protein